MPALLVSAAHKSSGKTTVSVGLAAALAARGLAVQPFKKGPDYIDPMWLTRAAGRPCVNLDPYLTGAAAAAEAYARQAAGSDIALIEGNKGLHDGIALDGSDSNAALARTLGVPVLLVIDARGMTRGVAPLLLGQQAFDRGVRIAGVVLNQVGGARHEAKLRAVIERYTDLPVLGAVAQDPALALAERHLGLPTDAETDDAAGRVRSLAAAIAAQVDLGRVVEAARTAAPLPAAPPASVRARARSVRIGIARDRAFGFYYADDLAALEAAGALLVPIDTLHDTRLPPLDGLLIGGGFPETAMAALEANVALRSELRRAIEAGLPTYAECGGLMYLSRSITWNGRRAEMVGAIPGDAVMHARPVGRGYVHLRPTAALPWPPADDERPGGGADRVERAHEFHHSSLENLDPGVAFAWRVERGHGIDGRHDGVVLHRLLAAYAHRRGAEGSRWPERFVAFVRGVAQERRAAAATTWRQAA